MENTQRTDEEEREKVKEMPRRGWWLLFLRVFRRCTKAKIHVAALVFEAEIDGGETSYIRNPRITESAPTYSGHFFSFTQHHIAR